MLQHSVCFASHLHRRLFGYCARRTPPAPALARRPAGWRYQSSCCRPLLAHLLLCCRCRRGRSHWWWWLWRLPPWWRRCWCCGRTGDLPKCERFIGHLPECVAINHQQNLWRSCNPPLLLCSPALPPHVRLHPAVSGCFRPAWRAQCILRKRCRISLVGSCRHRHTSAASANHANQDMRRTCSSSLLIGSTEPHPPAVYLPAGSTRHGRTTVRSSAASAAAAAAAARGRGPACAPTRCFRCPLARSGACSGDWCCGGLVRQCERRHSIGQGLLHSHNSSDC